MLATTLVLASLVHAPAARAEESDGEVSGGAAVPPVVVSGTRSEQSTITVPAGITVITRDEIEASGATNVVELLRGRGGLDVSDFYGDGSRTQVGMRGFGETASSNVLVLVDGRRLNNSDTGGPDFKSIPLQDVERVEIVQGSAGTLFGDQAVGGVINIITRRPVAFSARIEGSAGSYDRHEARADVSDSFGNGFSYRLAAKTLGSENFRRHNADNYSSLFARGDYDFAEGSLFAEYQRVDDNLELPGGLTPAQTAADRRQVGPGSEANVLDTFTQVARVGARRVVLPNWSFEGEFSHRTDDTVGYFFGSFRQKRRQYEVSPRLIGDYPLSHGDLLITAGGDGRSAEFSLDTALGADRDEQSAQAAYLQAVVPFAPGWRLTAGVRKAWVQSHLAGGSFPAGANVDDGVFVKELGLSYRPSQAWRLFLRRDENFRFPKVDEQGFTAPGTLLGTQTGVSWETGAEWSGARVRAKVVLYRLDLDNEISFDPTATGPFPGSGANVNLPHTRRQGVIVSGGWRVLKRLRLDATYTYTHARFESGGISGKEVPLVAPHDLRLSAEWAATARLHSFLEFQAVSSRVLGSDFLNRLPRLGGYGVANLHLDYRWRGLTVSARVNNLLDRKFVDLGFAGFAPDPFASASLYPAPGRNYWLGVSYHFD